MNAYDALPDATAWVLPVLLAVTLHEAAHGWMAKRFGDRTATEAGRVSFNPLRHVDLFGTVLLPGMLLLAHSPVLFGYAKPVPVNMNRLWPRRKGELCVAAAGPATNVLLALGSALLLHLDAFITPEQAPWIYMNLYRSVIINCSLAVFNLLPILPLDGGRVVHAMLPEQPAMRWARSERYGILLVLVLLFIPALGGVNILGSVVGGGAGALVETVLQLTGNGTAGLDEAAKD